MVRGSWLVVRKKRDCRMCDSLFLNFKFVVNRKSNSQTAFGGQLPYQGSQRDAPANCDLRPAGRPLGAPYYISTNGSWAGRSWCLWS